MLLSRRLSPLALCAALVGGAVPRGAPAYSGPFPQRMGILMGENLVVIDQRGERGQQVQQGAGRDEILLAQGGGVRQLLGGLTASCCGLGGLALSPRGLDVAFTQEPHGQDKPPTEGLWLATTGGTHLHRLLFPPTATNPAEPLSIGPTAWSPDRDTLAYAVNLYSDGTVKPDVRQGIWLTPYDRPRPRQVVTPTQLARVTPALATACHGYGLNITALAWATEARTLIVSVQCSTLTAAGRIAQAIVIVNTANGRGHILVPGGQDGAVASLTGNLTYVTGSAESHGRLTLWVADAQGRQAHSLVHGRDAQGGIDSPTWSPDERSIAFLSTSGVGGQATTVVRIVRVATGEVRTVLVATRPGLPVGGYFVRLAWLPHHR